MREISIYHYDTIDSTNSQAFRLAEEGKGEGSVVVADAQTAGKGRRGRTWESPAGENLYVSLLLEPDCPTDKVPMLTLLMALAGIRAIQKLLPGAQGEKMGIKWPNDLVVHGKKVCGILTELQTVHGKSFVVIGVGVNVRKRVFAEDLKEKATDMESECGQIVEPQELLERLLEEFRSLYDTFLRKQNLRFVKRAYNRRLLNRKEEVMVLDPKGEYRGKALGIDKTGQLVVRTADGKKRKVYAGEVSVRGIYGYV